MAEHMARDYLRGSNGWEVTSAGTAAGFGMPASGQAVDVMRERGIEMSGHLSRPVTRELVDGAAVVVVMTAAHRDQLMHYFPEAREKVFLLKSFCCPAGGDVEDPIGMSIDVYRRVAGDIQAALPELAAFLRELDIEG